MQEPRRSNHSTQLGGRDDGAEALDAFVDSLTAATFAALDTDDGDDLWYELRHDK